jgi:hypothetical protein
VAARSIWLRESPDAKRYTSLHPAAFGARITLWEVLPAPAWDSSRSTRQNRSAPRWFKHEKELRPLAQRAGTPRAERRADRPAAVPTTNNQAQ